MSAIENAKRLLHAGDCVCAVAAADGAELACAGQGLMPIITLLRENPAVLRGAAVADKVIGKAAAMLLVYGGAVAVWGGIMSRPALDFLETSGVPAEYGKLVPILKNRAGTGQCPMEAKAAGLAAAADAYAVFCQQNHAASVSPQNLTSKI
ncbi:MAG: DUF1893 domain-containing protein [Oscillospiraceae bacterium]|jgi:hypothetical protein|nr:DUF1893 domain-containing protein [Oscillospiraceae bacterium]